MSIALLIFSATAAFIAVGLLAWVELSLIWHGEYQAAAALAGIYALSWIVAALIHRGLRLLKRKVIGL